MEKPDREIKQIYTLIAESPDGKEGIVGTMPPFICSTLDNANRLLMLQRGHLAKAARENNVKIKVVKFCYSEVVEEIK